MGIFANHFHNSRIHETLQSTIVENKFNIILESIKQGPGVVGDYKIKQNSVAFQTMFPNIEVIELKHDKTSVAYNSFFCEYEQTSDGWFTTNKSGHLKAVNEGCLLIIQSGSCFYCFTATTFFCTAAIMHAIIRHDCFLKSVSTYLSVSLENVFGSQQKQRCAAS